MPNRAKNLHRKIADALAIQVDEGRIISRAQLINLLQRNFIINSISKTSVSIVAPQCDHPIRFTGGIFEEKWRPGVGSKRARVAAAEQWQRDTMTRIREAQKTLYVGLQIKMQRL